MARKRNRINISLDPYTYRRLKEFKEEHDFKNLCQLVEACVHVFLDRMNDKNQRVYDLPEDEGEYIDEMFEELGHVERTPDGTVPVRHNNKSIEDG